MQTNVETMGNVETRLIAFLQHHRPHHHHRHPCQLDATHVKQYGGVMPNHLKKAGCVSRININSVPVLSIFEQKDKSLSFMIYASKLPYLKYLKQNSVDSFVDQISIFKFALRDTFIEKTEGDEITLLLNQAAFKDALNNRLVLSSIRLFNLRMMNNVGKEIKFVRKPTHCLDLADTVINLLK